MPKTIEQLTAEIEALKKSSDEQAATITEQTTQIETLTTERDEAVTALETAGSDDGGTAEPDLGAELEKSDLSPAVKAAIKKSQDDAAELRKANEALRTDVEKAAEEREIAVFTERAAKIGKAIEKADEFGPLLRRVAKGQSTEKDADEIERLLKASSAQIDEVALLKAVGSDGAPVGDAFAECNRRAEELRKTNPTWSIEKARVEVFKSDPALKEQYKQETRALN